MGIVDYGNRHSTIWSAYRYPSTRRPAVRLNGKCGECGRAVAFRRSRVSGELKVLSSSGRLHKCKFKGSSKPKRDPWHVVAADKRAKRMRRELDGEFEVAMARDV